MVSKNFDLKPDSLQTEWSQKSGLIKFEECETVNKFGQSVSK